MCTLGGFELATAARIVFGAGRVRELPAIVAGRRTLLVTGRRGAPVPIDAVHHVRVDGEPTIDDARRAAAHGDVELVVAVGGGSALDLGKAAAAHKATAHYAAWRDAVAPLMAEPRSSTKYRAVFPETL